MPRPIPDLPKEDWQKPTVKDRDPCHIELITPMFGGGVATRVNDTTFPIRPTAIRGQLQFWWRATVGARYETLKELRAAQSDIWGSTERASRVQVRLTFNQADIAKPTPCARFDMQGNTYRSIWNSPFSGQQNALPYVLFPFQGRLSRDRRSIEQEPATYIAKASFKLILRCADDLWPQVEPAVWAWVNFGGLGSRTRRGCGAIRCAEFIPKDADDLAAKWKQCMPQLFPGREWPTLAGPVLLRTVDPAGDPVRVWNWLIGLLKDFRQGIPFARQGGPGRSHYPEPETIRRILLDPKRPWRHGRDKAIPNDAFPRAEFGLPIVFHFKPPQEPQDTVLYPSAGVDGKRRERMASPLILKPLGLANGNAIPLCLFLNAPPLTGVDLRQGEASLSIPPATKIRDAALATYARSPLATSANGSALEAFLAFAKAESFREV